MALERSETKKEPKPKVTIFATDVYGQPFAIEARLESHGRSRGGQAGNQLGMGASPYVQYVEPPRRRTQIIARTCYTGRYLLILAGWGHPKPPRIGGNSHGDPELLQPWEELIDRHVAETGAEVLGDYRDLIQEDYFLRKGCANDLHCLEGKPDQAVAVIDEYEDQARAGDCHVPEYWAMLREDYTSGRLVRN